MKVKSRGPKKKKGKKEKYSFRSGLVRKGSFQKLACITQGRANIGSKWQGIVQIGVQLGQLEG